MLRTMIAVSRSPRLTRHLATPALSKPQIWERQEIEAIYNGPLLGLVFRAASVHRQHHDPSKIQLCTLMNIKSMSSVLWPHALLTSVIAGGCTENCQ